MLVARRPYAGSWLVSTLVFATAVPVASRQQLIALRPTSMHARECGGGGRRRRRLASGEDQLPDFNGASDKFLTAVSKCTFVLVTQVLTAVSKCTRVLVTKVT
jgi:hypothetical protein